MFLENTVKIPSEGFDKNFSMVNTLPFESVDGRLEPDPLKDKGVDRLENIERFELRIYRTITPFTTFIYEHYGNFSVMNMVLHFNRFIHVFEIPDKHQMKMPLLEDLQAIITPISRPSVDVVI